MGREAERVLLEIGEAKERKYRFLVVDDEEEFRLAINKILEKMNISQENAQVEIPRNEEKLQEILQTQLFDIYVLDIHLSKGWTMGEGGGFKVWKEIMKRRKHEKESFLSVLYSGRQGVLDVVGEITGYEESVPIILEREKHQELMKQLIQNFLSQRARLMWKKIDSYKRREFLQNPRSEFEFTVPLPEGYQEHWKGKTLFPVEFASNDIVGLKRKLLSFIYWYTDFLRNKILGSIEIRHARSGSKAKSKFKEALTDEYPSLKEPESHRWFYRELMKIDDNEFLKVSRALTNWHGIDTDVVELLLSDPLSLITDENIKNQILQATLELVRMIKNAMMPNTFIPLYIPDLARICQVIHANARIHGGLEKAELKNVQFREVTEVKTDRYELVLDFDTGRAMENNELNKAREKLEEPFSHEEHFEKLPMLVETVVKGYDGMVFIISGKEYVGMDNVGGESKKGSLHEKTFGTTEYDGTLYRILLGEM